MRLSLVTAPSTTPVTLAEASAHVGAIGTGHDAKLTAMLAAAVGHIDGPTGILSRALIEQEWLLSLDAFPSDQFEIPLSPLLAISAIKYIDTDGVEQTLPTSAYNVDAASDPGVVSLAYGQSWPSTRTQRNAVTVQFTAGYGAAPTDVPQPLRSAILLMVGDMFENREAAIVGQPRIDNPTCNRLLFPFKRIRP